MSIYASTSFQTSFDAMIKQQYQEGMKLKDKVRIKTGVKGSTHKFRVINKGLATARLPQTDVTPMNIQHAIVTATLADWNAADYADVIDTEKLGFEEKMELVEAAKGAIGRRMDQIIIDALLAGANATTVSVNLGGTNTGINVEKILRAKRLMDEQGVPKEGRTMVISSYGLEQALQETQIGSSDYNVLRPLVSGEIKTWAGFEFIDIGSRDEGGLAVATNVRDNFAFHKDAIGLAIGLDMSTKVDYIPEKTSTLVNAMFSAGAVVIDNKGVFKIASYEA